MSQFSCNFCQAPAVISCSRCMSCYYCSVEHQRSDWRNHKDSCSAIPDYSQPGLLERAKPRKPLQKKNYKTGKWAGTVIIPTVIFVVFVVLCVFVAGGCAFFTYGFSLFALLLIVPAANIYAFILLMYEPVIQAVTNLTFYVVIIGFLSFVTGVCLIMYSVDGGGSLDSGENWAFVGTIIVIIVAFVLRIVAVIMCVIGRIEVCITEKKCCCGTVSCPYEWHGKTRKAIMMTRSIHLAGVFVHVLKVAVAVIWCCLPGNYGLFAIVGPINFLDIIAIAMNRFPDVVISIVRCIKRLQEPDDPPPLHKQIRQQENVGVPVNTESQAGSNPEFSNDPDTAHVSQVAPRVDGSGNRHGYAPAGGESYMDADVKNMVY